MDKKEYKKYCKKYYNRLVEIFEGKKPDEPFFLRGTSSAWEPWYDYSSNDYTGLVGNFKVILTDIMHKIQDDGIFRPLIYQQWVYGNRFMDKLFGADVYYKNGQWWADKLDIEVGSLSMPDIENSEIVKKTLDLTKCLIDQSDGIFYVAMQVLSSPNNLANNLFGERYLEALLLESEKARHDLEVITEVIIALSKKICEVIPEQQFTGYCGEGRFMPRGSGMLDQCATQLVSPNVYADMIAPLDDKILGTYKNGGIMHICGASSHQIPAFSKMKTLKAIQIQDRSTLDFEKYYSGLRDDQVIYVIPDENITIKKILKISDGGRRVVIISGEKE